MSQNNIIPQPVPVRQPTGAAVFELNSDAERIAYMKSLGAQNTEPPLPRSSHLRVKATGRIMPWIEMVAIQRDLVECCDASGNTDPAAWQSTVDYTPYDSEEERQLMQVKAQEYILARKKIADEADKYRVPGMANPNTPYPDRYPDGIVTYENVAKLLAQLE